MLKKINEPVGRNISKVCKRVGKGLLVLDLLLALSGHIYHYTKPTTSNTRNKLVDDVAALESRIIPNMTDYSAVISDFLNMPNKSQKNNLQNYFPDELSFHCFAELLQNNQKGHKASSYYYGYLLGLYTELGAPKLDTTRCLLNRLWLDCPHAGVSTVCFHGDKITEQVLIAELSHHVQFEKHAGSSIMSLILDIARIYNDPTRWYNKLVHDVDIYRSLYDEPGNIEYEAHVVIESLVRECLFTTVAEYLCADLVYLEEAKSDIRMHAEAIAAIANGALDFNKTGQNALMGTWSLEQVYTKYWFVAYLPKEHPFRVYVSNELKRFYLRYLYFVCDSENPKHRYLFMGNIIPLVEFSNFFNLTLMEQQEVTKALNRLTSHLQ